MKNQNLLSQTYNQIKSEALGGGNVNFQLLGNPIDFMWPVAATGKENLAAYQLMSMMPKWSPVGSFEAGDSNFFSAYSRVFTLLTFKVSSEKENDLAGLKDQCTTASNTLTQIATDTSSAYGVASQNGGSVFKVMYPDIAAWLAGPGSVFVSQTRSQTAVVKTLLDQYANFLAMFCTDSTIKEDADKMKTPSGPIGESAPAGWTKVENSDGSLSWSPIFNISTSGQDWRAKLTAGTAGGFTVNLDASKADSDIEKSWAKGSAGYDAIFWSVSGSGGWERDTEISSDTSVQATVKVQSSTVVPITPGSWYDGGLMKNLALNTAGAGIRLEAPWTVKGDQGSQSVFGQYGLLSTRVSGLVVVYKPSYSIVMKSSTFKSFHEKIDAKAGLRIGPFTFGSSGGHETTKVSSTGDRTTIESTSTSDNPLIIGITVAFPGVGDA